MSVENIIPAPIMISQEQMNKVIEDLKNKESKKSSGGISYAKRSSSFLRAREEEEGFWGQRLIVTSDSVVTPNDPYRVIYRTDENLDVATIYNDKVGGRYSLEEFLGAMTALTNLNLELIDGVLSDPNASQDAKALAATLGTAISNFMSESRSVDTMETDVGLDYNIDSCVAVVALKEGYIPSHAGAGFDAGDALDDYDEESDDLVAPRDSKALTLTDPYADVPPDDDVMWHPGDNRLLEETDTIFWSEMLAEKDRDLKIFPTSPKHFFVEAELFINELLANLSANLTPWLSPDEKELVTKITPSALYLCIASNEDLADAITDSGYLDMHIAHLRYVQYRDTLSDSISALCSYDSLRWKSYDHLSAEVDDIIDIISMEIDKAMYTATIKQS